MAFISEEIRNEKDKQYFKSIVLESMTGEQLTPVWWTIDRDEDIVLYERGGGTFEIPVGYGLYIKGNTINLEVVEHYKGSRYENNLIAFYFIKKIEIPSEVIGEEYSIQDIIKIIEEAFSVMGVPFVERSKILEINIKIIATPILL